MKELNEHDTHELYSQRLLVFLETEPQSNKYKQLMFTPDEFKKVSLSIGKTVETGGRLEIVEVQESEETYTLPDLKEIY